MTNEKSKLVLHADDGPEMGRIIESIFSRSLGEVTLEQFPDGLSLEERFLQSPQPDLVITDNRMPGLTGLEFIKKYSKIVPVPLVLVSGDNVGEVALKYGARAYFRKPFELAPFIETVRQILYSD